LEDAPVRRPVAPEADHAVGQELHTRSLQLRAILRQARRVVGHRQVVRKRFQEGKTQRLRLRQRVVEREGAQGVALQAHLEAAVGGCSGGGAGTIPGATERSARGGQGSGAEKGAARYAWIRHENSPSG